MITCGAVVGGVSIENVDLTNEAVIQGVVSVSEQPVSTGYVRLLDRNDEFVAEVPVSDKGEYRFFAASGTWHLVALIPGKTFRKSVTATVGKVTEVALDLP